MRHLTFPTALIAGCLIAGASWAQSSTSTSGGGGTGASSSTAAPSTRSMSSPGGSVQPNGSTLRPPVQGSPANAGQIGSPDVRNSSDSPTGTSANQGGDVTGNTATGSPIRPPGSEGSTGGAATTANRPSTDPATTGGVSGVNRLPPGQRSAVGPTPREEELFREGEELEQKVREGICSDCGVKP
jgi:hypothetical protein